MTQPLLDVQDLSKHFGGFTALNQVSLHVGKGERFGLIGPNGSGKTTMINCISGALLNESGRVLFQGQDITRLKPHQRTRLGIALARTSQPLEAEQLLRQALAITEDDDLREQILEELDRLAELPVDRSDPMEGAEFVGE